VSVPSIKGTAYQSVVDDLRELVSEGRLSREEIEVRLAPEDLRALEEKVAPARWYPIASYLRMLEVLIEHEAAGAPEAYLFQRGARAAERLSAAGIYPQLEPKTAELGMRVGSLITSLAGAIYNFTRWRFEADADERGFRILIEDADEFPNVARFTAEGFVHWVTARISGRRCRVWSERPAPDRLVVSARIEAR
jgi:hypothetical protein